MKTLNELYTLANHPGYYKSYVKNDIDDNVKSMDKKAYFDTVREYLIMRAICEEKITDKNQLQYLYNELNDNESPLYAAAWGLTSIAPADERYKDAHSDFIKKAIFDSARDGYHHVSYLNAKEYVDTVESAGCRSGYSILPSQRKKSLLDNEKNNALLFTEADMKPYTKKEAVDFHTKLKQVQRFLKPFIEQIIADDDERLNKLDARIQKKYPNASPNEREALRHQLDNRSSEYKYLARAARDYQKAITSNNVTFQELFDCINDLDVATYNYAESHDKITKAFFSKGSARLHRAKEIQQFINGKVDTLREMACNAYKPEGAKYFNADQQIRTLSKNESVHRKMLNLNHCYDCEYKTRVLSNYNLKEAGLINTAVTNATGKASRFSTKKALNKLAVQIEYDKLTLELRKDTLARAIVLEEIANEAKSNFQTIVKNSDLNQIYSFNPKKPFDDLDKEKKFNQLVNERKNDKKFQQMVKKALTNEAKFKTYLAKAAKGELKQTLDAIQVAKGKVM